MSEKVRLVAPAGNFQALKSAVIAGADAVYAGVDRFSARAFAPNFSLDELQDAVDFAHLHGCEVYVAMNTLVKNSELPDALSYLFSLQKIGVDAVVMQDIGLIALARQCMAENTDNAEIHLNTHPSTPIRSSLPLLPSLPPLKIFASTQTTAHSIESVELLADMGVSRAILARELSLSEMQKIADYVKRHSNIGLETFVHGALCISYSGQCLMSSFIGSRSGNRGRCSQPCRQKYALINHNHNGKKSRAPKPISHLLSPRDMMLLDHVCDLIDAGITSFKIEGRMRRYEYVASAVFAYRQAIDACLADKDVADILDVEKTKLEAVFTRGFTDYYLTGKGKLMQTKRPHNRGVRVGSVSDYNPRKSIAQIILTSPLRKDDGIRIESDLGDTGMLVRGDATKILNVRTDSPVAVGDAVFRTYDVRVMESIVEMVDKPLSMDIHVNAHVEAGKPLVIELTDTDGNKALATSTILAQKADKKPMSQDAFEKQLLKFGDTPFDVESYDIHIGNDVFLPIKVINETRRHAVSALIAQRVGDSDENGRMNGVQTDDDGGGDDANYANDASGSDCMKERVEKCLSSLIQNPEEYTDRQTASKPSLIVGVHDFDCGARAISQGADCIYLAWEGRKHLERLSEYAKSNGIAIFLKTAHITKDGDTLRKFLAGRKQIIDGIVAKNLTAVAIAKELSIPFVADYHLNIFNSIAMGTMHDMGAMRIVPSVELTLDELKQLQGAPTECIVHGDVEVMVSESDILKIKGKGGNEGECKCKDTNQRNTASVIGYTFGLVDEKGYEFPVFADEDGMTHVLNSKELCAISMISKIIDAGTSGLRIDAEHMEPEYMEKVVSYYRREIDEYLVKRKGYRFEIDRRKKLESLSPRGFTRGHYLRGVD